MAYFQVSKRGDMTKRILIALLLLAGFASAQNLSSVTGTKVGDGGGNLLANGQICFLGTDDNDVVVSYQRGGGGIATTDPICASITAGVIGTLNVANPAVTQPANIKYRITVTNTDSNKVVTLLRRVSFTGSPFNYDNYQPVIGNLTPISGNNVTGNLAVSGNLSVTGSITWGSAPSINYQTVQQNAVSLTQRAIINFSTLFSCADNAPSTRTDCTFANSGVSAGTYTKLTVDVFGRVTAGLTEACADLTDCSTLVKNNASNTYTTGAQDFSAATSLRTVIGAGVPAAGNCNAAGHVGRIYMRSDANATGSSFYVCSQTAVTPTFAWELAQPAGAGVTTFNTRNGAVTLLNTDVQSLTRTETNETIDAEATGNVITIPSKVYFDAAGCNGSTPSPFWDLPVCDSCCRCVRDWNEHAEGSARLCGHSGRIQRADEATPPCRLLRSDRRAHHLVHPCDYGQREVVALDSLHGNQRDCDGRPCVQRCFDGDDGCARNDELDSDVEHRDGHDYGLRRDASAAAYQALPRRRGRCGHNHEHCALRRS
jgi:hypothetical protein